MRTQSGLHVLVMRTQCGFCVSVLLFGLGLGGGVWCGGWGVGSRVHHTQKTTTNTVGQEVFQGLESRPFQLLYDPRNVGACSLNTEGLPEGNVVIHTGCMHFHT